MNASELVAGTRRTGLPAFSLQVITLGRPRAAAPMCSVAMTAITLNQPLRELGGGGRGRYPQALLDRRDGRLFLTPAGGRRRD